MGLVVSESSERRRYERSPVDIEVISRSTGKPLGQATNMSLGGLFIETGEGFEPGQKLLLEFNLPEVSMPAKAYCEVQWLTRGEAPAGIGVSILTINNESREKLEKHLRRKKKFNSDDHLISEFNRMESGDIFSKAGYFWDFMEDYSEKGFDNYARPLLTPSGNRVTIRDKRTGKEKEMIMMGSNNYLGLASHPDVIKAAKEAEEKYGIGAGGVPLLSGTFDLHKKLEARIARLKGCEDAILFSSGYSTNVGCISSLLGKNDIAVIDKLAHASIIDGCVLSGSAMRVFRHSDAVQLDRLLERVMDADRGALVIVDGVYSMDGDVTPLKDIVRVAHGHGARVMVDDAHATGVIGERGRGTCSHFNMDGKVDIVAGTLSKALGGIGGFVASTKEVIRYLRYYARSFVFSTSFPPVMAASVMAALDVMESDTKLHRTLWSNINYLKDNIINMGFEVGLTESAIIPVYVNEEMTLRKMGRRIHEEGIYLGGIWYPVVKRGEERFRLGVMATHTREDLDRTLEVLEKTGREFGLLSKPVPLGLVEDGGVQIREISSREDIEASVRFSWKVYKDCPAWIPYFTVKDHVSLLSGQLYYFRKVRMKRYIAEEQGEIVATVSAYVDSFFNRYHNKRVGFLGFFEALPHRDVAVGDLFREAIGFLKDEGCEEVIGPTNGIFGLFGGGLLSEGFEKEPSFIQIYTPPYYHEYFTNAGMEPVKKTLHYTADISPENVETNYRFLTRTKTGDVTFRKIDKTNWEQEIMGVYKVLNEANVPFDYDEFLEIISEFKSLIKPEFWLIAEDENKIVGFAGGFPNYAPVFKALDGGTGPVKTIKAALAMKKLRDGVIPVLAVLDKYRNRGVATVLAVKVCRAMADIGYDRIFSTWILEDNRQSRRLIEGLGSHVDRYWTIYGKKLGPELI